MTSKKKIADIATGVTDVQGMTLDDLADPALPWEVFFWTAR